MLLPDPIANLVRNKDITYLLINYKNVYIHRKLWQPQVETLVSFKMDYEVHKALVEEAISKKLTADILIRNILYKELSR